MYKRKSLTGVCVNTPGAGFTQCGLGVIIIKAKLSFDDHPGANRQYVVQFIKVFVL